MILQKKNPCFGFTLAQHIFPQQEIKHTAVTSVSVLICVLFRVVSLEGIRAPGGRRENVERKKKKKKISVRFANLTHVLRQIFMTSIAYCHIRGPVNLICSFKLLLCKHLRMTCICTSIPSTVKMHNKFGKSCD